MLCFGSANCNISGQKLGEGKGPCTSNDQCEFNLYCTPSILGERHCCPDGNIWKQDRLGNWGCTLTQDCTPGILNCILSNPNDIKNCIPKRDCIKAY